MASSAGARPLGVGLARPDELGHVDGPGPAGHPHGHTVGRSPARPPDPPGRAPTKLTTVTRRSRRRPLVVVVLLAKRTSASLPSVTTTTQSSAPRQGEGPLDDVRRRREPVPVAHRPVSARAFRTLMPRKSAVGQPWLTGATWGGWPFPQLKAPPRT